MKAFLFLLAMMVSFGFSKAQAPDTVWTRTYGGGDVDICRVVVKTSDGGYVMAGTTRSFGAGQSDFWLVKTDASGNVLWSHTYGGSGGEDCYSLQQTSDGGFILAGLTTSFGTGNPWPYEFWLVKTNTNGDSLWSHTYGTADNNQVCYSVEQTTDGGYILGGAYGGGFWLVKTNANGDSLWSRIYDRDYTQVCKFVHQTSDHGYVIGGDTGGPFVPQRDFTLFKVDSTGNTIEWSHDYGGPLEDVFYSAVPTSDGGYILAGNTGSFGTEGDAWLVKTDGDGNEEWSKPYGGTGNQIANSVAQTLDSGFIIGGVTIPPVDLWMLKAAANGDSLWSRTLGGGNGDACYSVFQNSDSTYILGGYTESFGHGSADFWLIRAGAANDMISFDGSTGYGAVADNSALHFDDDNFTIEATVVLDDDGTTYDLPVLLKGQSSNIAYYSLQILLNTQQPSFNGSSGISSEWSVESPDSISLHECHHIAGVRNGNTFIVYVDGLEKARETLVVGDTDTPDSLYIGHTVATSPPRYFPGDVDNVRLWNVARTPVQIASYAFSEVDSNSLGLVADYRCNEGMGSTLIDHALNPHNGSLHGGFGYVPNDCDSMNISLCGAMEGTLLQSFSPYNVVCNILVPAGDTLIIEPGVELRFTGPYSLTVEGTLLAEGTAEDSILFTTDTLMNPGRWRGIRFYDSNSSPSQLSYCIIENSNGDTLDLGGGGGLYCSNSSVSLNNCLIHNNLAANGAGVWLTGASSAQVVRCLIRDNSAANSGGGLRCDFSSSVIVRHCVLAENLAANGGALFTRNDALLSVINCTIANNTASSVGGGLYNRSGNTTTLLNNCIFEGNSAPLDAEIHIENGDVSATYSDISGGYVGTGNINANPLFVNQVAGDFHLTAGSPCIDSGDPTLYDPDCTYSDMGAFFYYHLARPESLTVQENFPHIDLCWSIVDSTECAMPSPIRSYVIYYEAEFDEDWNFLAVTTETCYRHEHVLQFAPNSHFYEVVATDYDPIMVNQIVQANGGAVSKRSLELAMGRH